MSRSAARQVGEQLGMFSLLLTEVILAVLRQDR